VRPWAPSAPASTSRLCGPQDAGWVTAMRAGGPPSRSATRSTTHRTSSAASSSGAWARPATTTGVGSPMRRLTSRTTRSGSVWARRSAASPTTTAPSGARNSTEGTAALREPRPTTSGSIQRCSSDRHTAAPVNVVPRSMPSWYSPRSPVTGAPLLVVPSPRHRGPRRNPLAPPAQPDPIGAGSPDPLIPPGVPPRPRPDRTVADPRWPGRGPPLTSAPTPDHPATGHTQESS
jgi:hypothetical protein